MVADCKRGSAATVMKNHTLLMVVEWILNTCDELIAEDTATTEVGVIFEVDNMNGGGFIGFYGKLV